MRPNNDKSQESVEMAASDINYLPASLMEPGRIYSHIQFFQLLQCLTQIACKNVNEQGTCSPDRHR